MKNKKFIAIMIGFLLVAMLICLIKFQSVPDILSSTEKTSDLINRYTPGTIKIDGSAELTLTLPKDLFKDNTQIKIVLFDQNANKELCSEEVDLNHTTSLNYKIDTDGLYLLYAFCDGDQESPIDLSKYTTIYIHQTATVHNNFIPLY